MEKQEYEDGTLPKHVETFVRQRLTTKQALKLLEDENMDEIVDGGYLGARPFTTSSDQ